MSVFERFTCEDLFHCNAVNLGNLTENYNLGFYLHYSANWPDFYSMGKHPDGQTMGYIMGKAEGNGEDWHGHVTAITVGPEFRRVGLANQMMQWLEEMSEKVYDGYFVDLFVRASNSVAVEMYKHMGYTVYRRVIGYYSGEEDACDMRKALPRDVNKKSIIPLDHPVYPHEVD
mmetsp:Transcript_38035/g.65239  ORF Transcript_38035/g.65239 Transcript_38035/m.65239 type:complete len:173 (+) Transcript_38035:21-539(+)